MTYLPNHLLPFQMLPGCAFQKLCQQKYNRNIQAVALLLKHGASLDLNCESDLKDMRGTALNQAIICHYESKRLVKMLKAHIQYHKEKEMRGKNNIADEYFYDRNNVMRSP